MDVEDFVNDRFEELYSNQEIQEIREDEHRELNLENKKRWIRLRQDEPFKIKKVNEWRERVREMDKDHFSEDSSKDVEELETELVNTILDLVQVHGIEWEKLVEKAEKGEVASKYDEIAAYQKLEREIDDFTVHDVRAKDTDHVFLISQPGYDGNVWILVNQELDIEVRPNIDISEFGSAKPKPFFDFVNSETGRWISTEMSEEDNNKFYLKIVDEENNIRRLGTYSLDEIQHEYTDESRTVTVNTEDVEESLDDLAESVGTEEEQ